MKENFLQENLLIKDGKMTDTGWKIFSEMLDFVGQLPNLTPGFQKSPHDIFEKLMSKVVPAAVELVLIRKGKVFLTWREDEFFCGWHFPGSFISPGEGLTKTCQRIADRETPGVKIINVELARCANHPDNPRFHDFSAVIVAEFEGEPDESAHGQWFNEKPDGLINAHQSLWQIIKPYLSEA